MIPPDGVGLQDGVRQPARWQSAPQVDGHGPSLCGCDKTRGIHPPSRCDPLPPLRARVSTAEQYPLRVDVSNEIGSDRRR